MKWMLRLYPPAWQRRYGEEFLELLRAQRVSIGLIVDVAAGAADAWFYPQATRATPEAAGAKENDMTLGKMLRLGCAGHGPHVTREDQWKASATLIGVTLTLSAALLTWQMRSPRAELTALWPMAYFGPYLVSLQFTQLKDRSARTKLVVIGAAIALFTAFFLVIGRIAELL